MDETSNTKHRSSNGQERKQTHSKSVACICTPHSTSCHLFGSLPPKSSPHRPLVQKTVGSWWQIANQMWSPRTSHSSQTHANPSTNQISRECSLSQQHSIGSGRTMHCSTGCPSSTHPSVCVNTFRGAAALALVLPKWMKSAK